MNAVQHSNSSFDVTIVAAATYLVRKRNDLKSESTVFSPFSASAMERVALTRDCEA